jgi:predicted RNA methylase
VADAAQLALLGEPAYRPQLQQWHTPPKLAARMASEFPVISAAIVLEPSAGGGSLVRAALDAGAREVVAVELDPEWCARLRARFADDRRVTVIEGDFLRLAAAGDLPPVEVALSNVPFDDGRDTDFLAAISEVAEDHVALTNVSALAGAARWDRVWSRVHLYAVRHLVRRPIFSGAAGGGMKDLVVTWSGRSAHAWHETRPIEWWPEGWS